MMLHTSSTVVFATFGLPSPFGQSSKDMQSLWGTMYCLSMVLLATLGPSSPVSRPDLGKVISKRQNLAQGLLQDLQLITAVTIPDSIEAASRSLENIAAATPTPENIVVLAKNLIKAGLTADNVVDLVDFVEGGPTGENSVTNVNLHRPSVPIYPSARREDAPYSVPEAKLRGAIHIPTSFRYGQDAQPIILVPGTGNTGYVTFFGNYIPLLTNSDVADPVWLNIPGYLNGDIQENSEYVAYAINYISSICNTNVALATWSQGGLNAQWAIKYWPSTRAKVTDIVAFSPDYKGTTSSSLLTNLDLFLSKAYYQQAYYSNFIQALRADGGDSTYVPTTTIYSGFLDLVVQPQSGENASAFLLDKRGVGVSHTEVQTVCAGQPASSYYSHEGILYNPIGYELLVDALTHDGPGQVDRFSENFCGNYLTKGLSLADLQLTENTLVVAVISLLLSRESTTQEPPVKAYAF